MGRGIPGDDGILVPDRFNQASVRIKSGPEDPRVNGVRARIGSFFLRKNGQLFEKVGSENTDWSIVLTFFQYQILLLDRFSRGATILSPSVDNIIVWRAPFPCTVIAVHGYRVGGNAANKINARKNGTDQHLTTDETLTANETWITNTNVQNVDYDTGDKLEIQITNTQQNPDQIAVQVDFVRPPEI